MFLSKTIKIGFFLNHSGARVHLTWVITNMHKNNSGKFMECRV